MNRQVAYLATDELTRHAEDGMDHFGRVTCACELRFDYRVHHVLHQVSMLAAAGLLVSSVPQQGPQE